MKPDELKDCFTTAIKDEEKRKKHKGLLITNPDINKAKEYINKAKINLEICDLFKERGYDYKIPEEWFYTLYYCALSILSRYGVESRSQKCTSYFLRYLKDKKIIDYDYEFIDRITVYKDKDEKSDVDERENSRYSPSIKIEDVKKKYDYMTNLCKKAISECEEIVYSEKDFKIPDELYK